MRTREIGSVDCGREANVVTKVVMRLKKTGRKGKVERLDRVKRNGKVR